MRLRLTVTLLMVWLVGCQGATTGVTVTPAPGVAPTLPPTATALTDGLIIRLGTPDPSPSCLDHYPWFWDNPAKECATTLINNWG